MVAPLGFTGRSMRWARRNWRRSSRPAAAKSARVASWRGGIWDWGRGTLRSRRARSAHSVRGAPNASASATAVLGLTRNLPLRAPGQIAAKLAKINSSLQLAHTNWPDRIQIACTHIARRENHLANWIDAALEHDLFPSAHPFIDTLIEQNSPLPPGMLDRALGAPQARPSTLNALLTNGDHAQAAGANWSPPAGLAEQWRKAIAALELTPHGSEDQDEIGRLSEYLAAHETEIAEGMADAALRHLVEPGYGPSGAPKVRAAAHMGSSTTAATWPASRTAALSEN